MLQGIKRVISPSSSSSSSSPSNHGQVENDDAESYADTYFREIGFKTGDNSLLGSTESPDLDREDSLLGFDDASRSMGLLDDNSLATDVQLAVAAAEAMSPPRIIGGDQKKTQQQPQPPVAISSSFEPRALPVEKKKNQPSFQNTPFHSYFGQLLQESPSSNNGPHASSSYAISYPKNGDDISISTLGEESIRRRPSPLNAAEQDQAEFKKTKQAQSQPKAQTPSKKHVSKQKKKASSKKTQALPVVTKALLEPVDLEKSRTRSTLEERPSDDSHDINHIIITTSKEEPEKVHNNSAKDLLSLSSEDDAVDSGRWKLIYFTIAVALVLMLAAAAVLVVSFLQLTQDNESGTEDQVNTRSSVDNTWVLRDDKTDWTATPSQAPVFLDPLELAREDLLQLLSAVSPVSLSAIGDITSAQYRAFDWASSDPDYLDYTVDRILQRWTLAVLYFSMGGDLSMMTRRHLSDDNSNTTTADVWLSDVNECQWSSSDVDSDDQCNQDGEIVSIHLSNIGLVGSIPPEVALLAKSLERLYLAGNSIGGTIPFEVGALTKLERLQLTSNNIEGTIPSEFALLTDLRVLGLGRNSLIGSLPEFLGSLDGLSTLGLEGNDLDGTIPVALSDMANLQYLSLESNDLTGSIPSELDRLTQLSLFSVHQNDLMGTMPLSLCPNNDTDIILTADCEEVECECCTLCCYGCEDGSNGFLVANTQAPTNATSTMAPTSEFNMTESPSDEIDAATVVPSEILNETDAPQVSESMAPSELLVTPSPTDTTSESPTMTPSELLVTPSPTHTMSESPTMAPSELLVTPSPTDTTTESPTIAPTTSLQPSGLFDALGPAITALQEQLPSESPSQACESQLTVDQRCYERDEGIDVEFKNCNPTSNDWVGIFDEEFGNLFAVGETAPTWNDSEVWIRGCGNRECSRGIPTGTVVFGGDQQLVREGTYRLFLVRRLVTLAISDIIIVDKNCN